MAFVGSMIVLGEDIGGHDRGTSLVEAGRGKWTRNRRYEGVDTKPSARGSDRTENQKGQCHGYAVGVMVMHDHRARGEASCGFVGYGYAVGVMVLVMQ